MRPFLFFGIAFLSCINSVLTAQSLPTGKWININSKTDTLFFTSINGKKFLELRRGKELSHGVLLPKPFSGLYEYKLSPEEISLHWSFSDDSSFKNFYFNYSKEKIIIGNFYDALAQGALQTFKTIE